MKKLLLALALLACGTAHAQITYEARYGFQVQPFKLSTGQVKYIGYSSSTNSVRIYNNDNSLYKAVSLPAGTTFAYEDFFYLSDKLFNNDTQLEFATSVGSNNNFVMKVYNENGTQLFSQDSCTNAQIYNTPIGAKMFIRIYRANSAGTYYKVYALAGTYTPLAAKANLTDAVAQPFPNPTVATISLPYQVDAGQLGKILVYSTTGQIVADLTVDSNFDRLNFDTSRLAKGIYFYQLTVNGNSTGRRRFDVQ